MIRNRKFLQEVMDELKEPLKVHLLIIFSVLMDAVFLIIWIILQSLVSKFIIEPYKLTGVDVFTLNIFQYAFALSTIAPIMIYIYKDIIIMVIKAQNRINDARNSITNEVKDE